MIIDDLDIMGISALPNEADTPLIVDPNTMLSRSITFQFLKAVGRRNTQRFQLTGRSKHFQFTGSQSLNIPGEPTRE